MWLHWCEYLKAQQEFECWLSKQQAALDAGVELQLGLKEKVWQVDQQRVLVSDVHCQSLLLERLLDEAAVLYSRTQDPSVAAQAQEQLQEAYNTARDQAEVRGQTVDLAFNCTCIGLVKRIGAQLFLSQERLLLLQKMVEEHQTFQSHTHKFQSWLRLKTKDLAELMEKDCAEDQLEALRVRESKSEVVVKRPRNRLS